jgi:hypothetical protein
VSAGNGTYTTTKRWRTITSLDCSDNAAGGGTVWADGTLAVTQDIWGVIWNLGNSVAGTKQYRIDAIFKIGDASTATYFTETNTQVVFSNPNYFQTTAASATTFGVKIDAYAGRAGCHIITIQNSSDSTVLNNLGTLNLYDTVWQELGTQNKYQCRKHQFAGTYECIQCVLSFRNKINFKSSPTSIYNCTGIDTHNGVCFEATCAVYGLVLKSHVNYPITIDQGGISATLQDSVLSAGSTALVDINANSTLNLIDCTADSWTMDFSNASAKCYEKYTFNIKLCDKDGVAILGATVDCEDTTTTAVWTAGTITTDASGNIAEQIIQYRSWVGTSETLTTYSPHKFTISKAGYETLVIPGVTVSAPIKWTVQLAPTIQYPDADDVRDGTTTGSETGNLVVPVAENLRLGVGAGSSGTEVVGLLDLPNEADVKDGVSFDNSTKTGTYAGVIPDYPPEDDVELGESFADGVLTGNLVVPDAEDILAGVGAGSSGTEIIGTLQWFFGQALSHTIAEQALVQTITEQSLTHAISEQSLTHQVGEAFVHTLVEQRLVHLLED